MRPRQAYHVLEELLRSEEAQLYRKAVRLSPRDNQTALNVYLQWFSLLLDLGYLHPEVLQRDVHRLWRDISRVDVLSFCNTMSECLMKTYHQDVRGLKSLLATVTPHFYPLIKEDVRGLSEGKVTSMKKLVQAFAYTSRLSLVDLDLTEEMLDSYYASERSIPTNYDPMLIMRLNQVIRNWVGASRPYEIFPRHSEGGIAEEGRCTYSRKYSLLGTDAMIRYAFPLESNDFPLSHGKSFVRRSKTIFVPKSYKTFRTISMEPATLMYYQQGVLAVIDKMITASPYLRRRVDTHDQERNRHLAQVGSAVGSYATLDLSAASDSVGYDLVKQLFKGTWLLRYLVCTRSRMSLLPDGVELELRKFAPMGSALCFPIETLVFAAVCEIVTQEHRVAGDFSVYGDDIIVPTRCVGRTMEVLAKLGFRVNMQKSFYEEDCSFRESCGGEYFRGQEITPLRISRKYCSDVTHDDAGFTSLIELANSAYDRGFRTLRQCYLADLRNTRWDILFSPSALHSDNYTNYHLEHRWNHDLQRDEVRCRTLVSTAKAVVPEEEAVRYAHWLISTARRKPFSEIRQRSYLLSDLIGDGFTSCISGTSVKQKRRWVDSSGLITSLNTPISSAKAGTV